MPLYRLLTVLFLLTTFTADIANGTTRRSRLSVTVSDILNVARGRHTTLDDLYKIKTTNVTRCRLVYIPQSSPCGFVWPSAISCSNTNATQKFTFHHHGCLGHYEMLNFRAEVETDVSLIVELFSISVHIIPDYSTMPQLITKQISLNSNSLTILCPISYTNLCSFSVLRHSLDANGNISGPLYQQIPCGRSPIPSFSYDPFQVDAIFIKTTCLTSISTTYHVVPLTESVKLQTLATTYLHVKELMETVVPSLLLPLQEISKRHHFLELLFPIESTGGIYSLLSSNKGSLDVTTFTYDELLNGKVVFRPTEGSIAAYFTTHTQFHYYVLSWTGRPVAEGILEIKISPRTSLRPSIRKNTGITLKEGTKASLSSHQLNFYPPNRCSNYTVTVMAGPKKGFLLDSKGNDLHTNDSFNVFFNSINITYQHHDLESSTNNLLDTTQWKIQCSDIKQTMVTLIPLNIIFEPKPTVVHCNVSLMSNNGFITPIHAHSHSLCGVPTTEMELNVQKPHLGELLYWSTPCSLYKNTSKTVYPYIHYSDIPPCVNSSLPPLVKWDKLLYRVNGNETLRMVLKEGATNMSIFVTLQISSISNINYYAIFQSEAKPTEISLLPYMEQNKPLPILTTDSIFITSKFLYVHSLGYLQKEIVFHLTSFPENGYICHLQNAECRSSIKAFTQEDILANNVYYKPHSKPKNDFFHFQVFYTKKYKLSGVYQFNLTAFIKNKPTPFKKFWVDINSEKILMKKYFIHYKEYFGTNKLNFTVLEGPTYGLLHTTVPGLFTWRDVSTREVTYQHLGENVCSDKILLKITAKNGQSITTNFTIPIRISPEKKLSLNIKEHHLQGEYAFTLSTNDFEVHSGFCLEFVEFSVITMPGYGFLQIYDGDTNTLSQMTTNGSFFGDALQEGRVMYRTYPDLLFLHNTEDEFQLDVNDPRGNNNKVKRGINNIFKIIIINIENNQTKLLNLTIVQPKQITKLDNDNYGAVLGQDDMYLSLESDFVPSEIFIHIVDMPKFGEILKDGEVVHEFSLEDIYANRISYILTLYDSDTTVTSDEFKFFTFIFMNKRIDIKKSSFSFEWCYFDIVPFADINAANSLVTETQKEVNFIVRRIGANSTLSASVDVVTQQVQDINAAYGAANCTVPPNWADYCNVNKTLYFPPREIKQSVSIKIIDNKVPEGTEKFDVILERGQNCFVPKTSRKRVFISDREDNSEIGFYKTQNSDQCPSVAESIGVVNITLLRTGVDLNRTDTVICYTSGTSTTDYIPRPRNHNSLVYFNPGEVYANCTIQIINDNINEPKESFSVYLDKAMGGYASINRTSDSTCVFIDHDQQDVPLVYFESSQIFIKEKRKGNASATFVVKRTGSDLNSLTKIRCILREGNATAGEDYEPYSIQLEFKAGQTQAQGTVTILPDVKQEGNEVFYIVMTTPYNGRTNLDDNLEVVIIDSIEDMTIGLSFKKYYINETDMFVQLPLYRHGDISLVTNVTCILKPLTADISDLVIWFNEIVEFPVNSTSGACSIFLQDDLKREGKETIMVTIITSDPLVKIAGDGTATVFIDDIEDAPHVQFSNAITYIQEPLSNHPVDYKEVTLALTRTGDVSLNASVNYYTSSTDNTINQHEGNVYFLENTVTNIIKIPINFDSGNRNRQFYVHLEPDRNYDVQLGPLNKGLVIIQDIDLKGALFPAKPQIKSFVNSEYNFTLLSPGNNNTLYYDLPLVCITPCDLIYTQPDNTSYIAECTKQAINSNNTKYSWHVSYNGVKYDTLMLDTLFADTHSQILESVYLRSGVWISCTATAIDESGIKGYSRTSSPVLLNEKFLDCGNDEKEDGINVTFSTYEAFRGHDRDFVKLTVTFPAISNAIPILTTKSVHHSLLSLLTRYDVRRHYPCSTVTPSGINFLPRTLSSSTTSLRSYKSNIFYKHYKEDTCHWKFQVWLPLKLLIKDCMANMTQELPLSMPLYISHLSIINKTAVLKKKSEHTVQLFRNFSYHDQFRTVLPFNYYPVVPENATDVYFSPIAIERVPESHKIRVVGYSHSAAIDVVNLIQENSSNIVYPVYVKSKNETGWIIDVEDDQEVVSLKFKTCHNHCMDYIFRVLIDLDDDNQEMRMRSNFKVTASLIQNHSNYTVTREHVLQVAVYLDPLFILKSDFALKVSGAKLCKLRSDTKLTSAMGGCDYSNINQTIELMSDSVHYNSEEKNNNGLMLYFVLSNNLTITGTWYLHTSCIIQSRTNHNISRTLVITPLQFSLPTAVASSPPLTVNTQSIPTYATVLFLITLMMLVSVCSITLVLLACTIRKKWLMKRKDKVVVVVDEETTPNNEVILDCPSPVKTQRRNNLKRYKIPRSTNSLLNSITKKHEYSSPPININKLHKSKSLPNLSTQKSKADSPQPMIISSSVRKSNQLISELQSLTKKERTNVLIATVKPLSNTSSCNNIVENIDQPCSAVDNKAQFTKKTLSLLHSYRRSYQPQGVGWYERCQSRQKALAMYSQIYQTANNAV